MKVFVYYTTIIQTFNITLHDVVYCMSDILIRTRVYISTQ